MFGIYKRNKISIYDLKCWLFGNMTGLKPVFCKSINKGKRVGCGRGGGFSLLGGLGSVSKINLIGEWWMRKRSLEKWKSSGRAKERRMHRHQGY